MSLSNKELLDKTLFLKDSVLFISKDGKEYEVSNPMDIGFSVVIGDTMESFLDRFIKPGEKIEWPGEVELNWRIAISTASDTKYTPCTEEYAKSKPGFHSYAVARLLPQEKKIYNPALSGYKPESDYKQFEPWSKEQFNSPQNQNRDNAIVGFLKTGLDKIDELGVNLSNDDKAKLLNRRIENLSKQVESSEPQEKEPDSFYGYLEEGVYGEFRHVPEPSPNKNKIGFIFGSKRYEFTRCPAPVESQEELWREVKKIIQTAGVSYLYKLEKKFSITRLTP